MTSFRSMRHEDKMAESSEKDFLDLKEAPEELCSPFVLPLDILLCTKVRVWYCYVHPETSNSWLTK